MTMQFPARSRELVSLLTESGELELSLAHAAIPEPAADEVVVRVEAAPINPSDLLLLLAGANVATLSATGSPESPVLRGPVASVKPFHGRVGRALSVGNEGAGTVVATGSSAKAQALLGKLVSVAPGSGMYAELRVVHADQCLVLNEGTSALEAASAWINPLTALGFVETMRREGHHALVNTAAASNLGQMLVRICARDGIPLVNIVRSAEQVRLLKELGAKYVCNSEEPSFANDLTEALFETKATIGFDAIGGGSLVNKILSSMEAAINRTASGYSRYGSPVHKQVYIYGGLDPRATEITRSFGVAWGVGGWLVTPFLLKLEPSRVAELKQRIADEIRTTFASPHAKVVSLTEALALSEITTYAKRATGMKYLITPQRA